MIDCYAKAFPRRFVSYLAISETRFIRLNTLAQYSAVQSYLLRQSARLPSSQHLYFHRVAAMPSLFQTVTTTSLFVLGPVIYFFYQWRRANQSKQLQRAEDELHPLLKDHTTFRSYTTKHHYPLIRTFYRPHPRRDKHEDIAQLPLIVFIHGLGGVLPQFAPLLQSLTNIAPCFGLELPGHGRSTFAPSDYDAYTIESNVALWKVAIEEVCEDYGHSSVVIIGQCRNPHDKDSAKSYVQVIAWAAQFLVFLLPPHRRHHPCQSLCWA